MKNVILTTLILALASCASSSGVVPMGKDTFFITRRGGSGFEGRGTLKVDVIREATEYCTSTGKQFQVVGIEESKAAWDYPRAEIQFMCLSADDPELTRPKLVKAPQISVEIKK